MDKDIEKLDKEIVELLAKRFNLYIDEIKKTGSDPIQLLLPAEKNKFLKFIESQNSGLFSGQVLRKIYDELLTHALNTIRTINVAFLGPEGTFSHSAMLEIFGDSVHPVAARTIHDVFVETETGRADFGVAPIENSTEGGVTYTLDELLDTSLRVVGEKYLRISCSLLSAAGDADKIVRIYSHPQPIAQCKEWIRKNCPNAEVIQVSSTTIAAETASNDKSSAAIASEAAAGKYKLNVLAGHIEDSKNNYTRFLIMGEKESPQTGKDKTSIICAVKDKAGALYKLLQPFNEQGINMTKIESRPDKKKMWAYNFFIDFMGHKDSKVVQNALEKMKEELVFLKILGSYPAEN